MEEQITTTLDIHPQFGKAFFFEFELSNPFAVDQLIDVHFHDRELRIVRDIDEWKYLHRIHGVRGGSVEKDMVALNPMDGTPQVWLRGNESISIPFVYQSFRMTANSADQRIVPVSFLSNGSQKPIALLDLQLHNHVWFPVDQSIRYYHPENGMLRTKITYAGASSSDRAFDTDTPQKKYLRSSHSDILCYFASDEEHTRSNGNARTVHLKYRCGKASAVPETFYVLFYDDPYQTSLSHVWRFFVHTMERLDVHCILGQRTTASLVMRSSDGMGRVVQCFPSSLQNVSVSPADPFDLVANALNEVKIHVRPESFGQQHYLLHVIGRIYF